MDKNVLKERAFEYTSALLLALNIFFIFSIYLLLRRGFYDLYIINKIFAGVAAVLLGIVLLLGALSRMFSIFDAYLRFRNELGIVAFLFAFAHATSSLFFLGEHFPFVKYFVPLNVSFLFGLTGIIILFFLFLISNQKSRNLLTVKRWWPIQYWGVRIVLITTALHVFTMKYPGWIEWYKKGGDKTLIRPDWPGLGLLIGWFILFVIIIRLTEAINTKLGRIVTFLAFVLLPLAYIFTFIWGLQFAR